MLKNYTIRSLWPKLSLIALVLLLNNCKDDAPEPLVLGQMYQGGIIVFLNDDAQHGLIAATTDQHTNIHWCTGSCKPTNALATAPGSGMPNTTAIVTIQKAGNYAASLCDQLVHNGYDDWFLPSKDELNFLFSQKQSGRISNFLPVGYWSSTEFNTDRAWIENMGSGDILVEMKENSACVRAMRAF